MAEPNRSLGGLVGDETAPTEMAVIGGAPLDPLGWWLPDL